MSSSNKPGTVLSPLPSPNTERRELVIPNAAPVRLQTLDYARHVAVASDGKCYIVATYDETHLGRGIISVVYPQQNGYLTLVRLPLYEQSSGTLDEALECHVELVYAIQQGKLRKYRAARQ
jgi:hypothetical protein